jgi:Uma2 family endonuclease
MSERRAQYGVDEYLTGEEIMCPQELVWGYVREAPSPAPPHQSAVLDFAVAWRQHVGDRRLGVVIVSPMDCVLDRDRGLVVQPDVLFVSATRAQIITDRIWGSPDLVLEVLSPRPRIGTLDERLEWFATYGVRECWLYHQFARDLEVLTFNRGTIASRHRFDFHDRIVSSVLPAFDSSCADILSPIYY